MEQQPTNTNLEQELEGAQNRLEQIQTTIPEEIKSPDFANYIKSLNESQIVIFLQAIKYGRRTLVDSFRGKIYDIKGKTAEQNRAVETETHFIKFGIMFPKKAKAIDPTKKEVFEVDFDDRNFPDPSYEINDKNHPEFQKFLQGCYYREVDTGDYGRRKFVRYGLSQILNPDNENRR
jgi:hypothetical protein